MKKGLNTGIKVLLLHPQQRISSLQYWQANEIKEKIYFLKKIYKSLWDSKALITFAPRKTSKVPWQIDKKSRRNEIEIISKKTSNFSCQLTKKVLLLHPLVETMIYRVFIKRNKKNTFLDILNWQPSRYQAWHKNKSNRIDRFEYTDRIGVA